jgi:cytochrome c oxidase cbb3-type subunit III
MQMNRTSFAGRSGLLKIFLVAFLSFTALTASAQDVQHRSATRRLPPPSSAGEQTFSSACAPCHGLDGRGGERAPDIATRPEISKLSDQEILGILRTGIPDKGMPPFAALGSAKLSTLLSYLRSLQGKGAATSKVANTEKGKELFSGKAGCSACHMLNGIGGFLGRDLSNYGETHSVSEIRAAIVEPQKSQAPRSRSADIVTKDGKTYSGVIRNEDNFSVQLQSLDGAFHFFSKADLAQLRYRQEPLMPTDYGSKLTPAELDALTAYLAGSAHPKQKRGDDAWLQ